MTASFSFEVTARDGLARVGAIATPRGTVRTPAFMPVGTGATVKAMFPEDVRGYGRRHSASQYLSPDAPPGRRAHRQARRAPPLHALGEADPHRSGGYQVMSLAKLRRIGEEGVTFQSHIDGAEVSQSPERAIEKSVLLGADIQMVLDECTPFPATREEAQSSLDLSLRWAERSKAAFARRAKPGQALFGIVRGSVYPDLRERSARALMAAGFDGYAIGGLAVGRGRRRCSTWWRSRRLSCRRTGRYLMGVGTPEDLLLAIARGIDMFDCVMPTRSGRHCQAFTWGGKLNLRNARHAEDATPLDPESACPPRNTSAPISIIW